jgi:hypothetical protein
MSKYDRCCFAYDPDLRGAYNDKWASSQRSQRSGGVLNRGTHASYTWDAYGYSDKDPMHDAHTWRNREHMDDISCRRPKLHWGWLAKESSRGGQSSIQELRDKLDEHPVPLSTHINFIREEKSLLRLVATTGEDQSENIAQLTTDLKNDPTPENLQKVLWASEAKLRTQLGIQNDVGKDYKRHASNWGAAKSKINMMNAAQAAAQ